MLNAADFDQACSDLLAGFEQCRHLQGEWQSVEVIYDHETKYLRITKTLPNAVGTVSNTDDENTYDELVEDDDDEVLQTPGESHALVNYDVLFSPVYHVPVLYISILDPQHRYPPTMATLYSSLIPSHFKEQTEHGGVIGGVTITDHPATSRPVFFIHPCQTADVMQASIDKKDVTPYEYLVMWMGALGKCVGLNVPLALAARG